MQRFGLTQGELDRYREAMLRDSAQLAAQAKHIPSLDTLDFVMESLACGHTVMDNVQASGGGGYLLGGGEGGSEESWVVGEGRVPPAAASSFAVSAAPSHSPSLTRRTPPHNNPPPPPKPPRRTSRCRPSRAA